MFLEWFNFIYPNWNMRTKNVKSHVTDHVIFCWLATSSNGHFFRYFLWLCFWCLTRFAENGSHSQVKWNKKGLGNFDGLEQKPKESNVTLITSYPSRDSLCKIASFVHLQQIDLQIFTFRLNPKRSRDESFQISQNGWCGLFFAVYASLSLLLLQTSSLGKLWSLEVS